MIIMLIKKLIAWIKDHAKAIIFGAAGAGAVAAGAGVANAHKGKKINKRALSIQQAALERHESTYNETQKKLYALGLTEKNVIDSFPEFADTMEKIQGRPEIKTNIFSRVRLQSYEPEELKRLSNDVQMALVGVGGAGAGALAGLAAFGASAIVAAPALLGCGIVICAKGVGLKKKAIENERQAKEMKKNVDVIIEFYEKLQETTTEYQYSINGVYQKYRECLLRAKELVAVKTSWKEYSREEKKLIENTILLARLLYEMCKTDIIVKQESEDKLETINAEGLSKLEKKSAKLLEGIA